MNPTQEQFYLNRAASRKQFPISGFSKTTFALCIALLTHVCVSADAEVYYTYIESTGISMVQSAPKDVKADRWEVWTFGKEHQIHAGSKSSRCGLFVGASAGEVMDVLKQAQKAELDWEKVTGRKETQCSFFNFVGPIAILKKLGVSSSPERQQAVAKLEELKSKWDELKEGYESMKRAAEIVGNPLEGSEGQVELKRILGPGENPYKASYREVGSLWKDYVENLQAAQSLLLKLHSSLEDALDSSLSQLDRDFAELQKNIETARQNVSALTTAQSNLKAADDLPDPLKPTKLERERAGNFERAFSAAAYSGSSDSPLYARDMAKKAVTGIKVLCNLVGNNLSRIEELKEASPRLVNMIQELESEKIIKLSDFRRTLIGSGSQYAGIKTWTVQLPGKVTSRVEIRSDSLFARDVASDGQVVGVIPPLRFTDIQSIGEATFSENRGTTFAAYSTWSVGINGNQYRVEFSNKVEAEEFKQMLERKLHKEQAVARFPTQAEIEARERELDATIVSRRLELTQLQAALKRLGELNEEARSQIKSGIGLWRTAVTFENNLHLQAAQLEIRSAREEKNKVLSKLEEVRRDQGKARNAQEIEQINRDEALWTNLLNKCEQREKDCQTNTKLGVLRAREQKLAEYQRISGFLQPSNASWMLGLTNYKPVDLNDPDYLVGAGFKFGQLTTPGAGNDTGTNDNTQEQVKLFISKFRETRAAIGLIDATGIYMAEGDAKQDELLLMQNAAPTRKTSTPQPRKDNNDLPLP